MVIVTHKSCDSVSVGTGKQKGLESLSENCEWRRRCDVERQVVPDGGTRNRKGPQSSQWHRAYCRTESTQNDWLEHRVCGLNLAPFCATWYYSSCLNCKW